MNCAGAPRMEAGLPDVDTEYNVDGRAAHKLAADVLEAARDANSLAPGLKLLNATKRISVSLKEGGRVAVAVTDEMRNAIKEYVAVVWDAFLAFPAGTAKLYIEQKVSLDKLDPPEEMFGTADAVIIAPAHLQLFDLKYGVGVVVEVEKNPQLLEYALGAMLTLPHEGTAMWADTTFETTIVQPRAHHPDGIVRGWSYGYDEIRAFGHEVLAAANRAQGPDAPLTPGPWCRWCKAAAFCPALLRETQDVAQREFSGPAIVPMIQVEGRYVGPVLTAPQTAGDVLYKERRSGLPLTSGEGSTPSAVAVIDAKYEMLPPDPDRIPMEQALAVLDKAEMVEGFIAAIRERIRTAIRDGLDVPGWKLVAGRPVREWVSESQLEQWAMRPDSGLGPEELYEQTLRSPAQIEKIVGKKNLPAELYRKVSKSEKLVRVEDPRPALPSSAQREFAALPPATDPNPTPGGGTGDVDIS